MIGRDATTCDVCVLMTEWNEYRGLDLEQIRELMAGSVFVDLRNVYEAARMRNHGFTYACIGREVIVTFMKTNDMLIWICAFAEQL